MTIDFLPGDRVRISSASPYAAEFNGKFATVAPVSHGAVRDWVTVAPDGDPTCKGGLETKYLTYIPKRGDIVHVEPPGLPIWMGDHEVTSNENDTAVWLRHSVSSGHLRFSTAEVTLVLRADEPAPATDPVHVDTYPVGCTVLDVKYGRYGTVVEHRSEHGATFPVVLFVGQEGTAPFPNPEERLQRVHILTHEELTLIDDAVPVSDRSYDKVANEILSKHLHPTVTETFTVTVTGPEGRPAISEADLYDIIDQRAVLHESRRVEVKKA